MDDQELFALFRKSGYKVTTQRLAIYKFISTRKDHPSAEQIYQALKNDYPTISLGTVYKTLDLLEKLGLLQKLRFNEDRVRYDPDMDLHINMVCSKCGQIYDYKTDKVKNLWKAILTELKVKPIGQRIDIYYDCDDCKNINTN
ncbi:MAG: Fur family transcriptional regulator [Candidatus Odinarchaeota archaeon]